MAKVYEEWGLSQEELEAAFLVFIEDFKNDESRQLLPGSEGNGTPVFNRFIDDEVITKRGWSSSKSWDGEHQVFGVNYNLFQSYGQNVEFPQSLQVCDERCT